MTYSDRFIPSRAASARLNFSLLDREAAAAEPARGAEREDSNPAYNLLLRSELLGAAAGSAGSPERGSAAGSSSPLGRQVPAHITRESYLLLRDTVRLT